MVNALDALGENSKEKLRTRVKDLESKNEKLTAKNEKLEADLARYHRLILEHSTEGVVEIKCADGVTYRGDCEMLKAKSGYVHKEGKVDCLTDVAASGVKLVLLRLLCAEENAIFGTNNPSALLAALTTVARLEINDGDLFLELTSALGGATFDADQIVTLLTSQKGLPQCTRDKSRFTIAQGRAIGTFLRKHGFLTHRDLIEQLPLAAVAKFLDKATGFISRYLEAAEDQVDISFSKTSSTMEDGGWDSLVESDKKSGWRAALVITKDETPPAQPQDDDDDEVMDTTAAETAKVMVEVSIFPRRTSHWKSVKIVIRSGKKEFIVDTDKAGVFSSPSIPVATVRVPFVTTVSDLRKIEGLDVSITPVASTLQRQVDFITAWGAAKQSVDTTTPCGALAYLESLDIRPGETEEHNDDDDNAGSGDPKKAELEGLDSVRRILIGYVAKSLYLSSGTDANVLSASAMRRVLAQKNLRVTDAADEEPELAVLKVALQWAKARGEEDLNDVLDAIRLPFIPLADLPTALPRDDYDRLKLCPKFKLLGTEALNFQFSRKRPRAHDGITRCDKRARGLEAPKTGAADLFSLIMDHS